MTRKTYSNFSIKDVPEFQRFRDANPQNPDVDPLQAIIMYGRAIHWIAILNILWPDFDKIDKFLTVEVRYIVANDPDDENLPLLFYNYIANMIAMFWELQLEQKHSNWDWTITIDDDPEVTLELEIRSKS